MAIEIRQATEQDYDDLCALSEQVDSLHWENLGHLFRKPPGPAREREYILGLLADPKRAVFVAEAAGLVVGLLVAELCETPPVPILVPRRYVVVNNMVVHPRFQRSGAGRKLMERVQRWAAAQGASDVELTVYDFNEAARAFYESLGYVTLSRRMARRLDGG